MTHLLNSIMAALLLALGFTGCSPGAGEPPAQGPGRPASAVGTQLATWGQAQFPDIQDNPELPMGPALITTESERDRLLTSQPLGPDLIAVAAVDLRESVIVVAGYHSCQERGAVWSDGVTVWWDAQPPAGAEHIDCAWAPFTVDIHEVPRSAFASEVALVTPPWDDEDAAPAGSHDWGQTA